MSNENQYFKITTDPKKLRPYYTDKRLWQGVPSIGMSKGGRIFATFYSTGWREDIGNASFIIISDDDGATFTEPVMAAIPAEGHRTYDAGFWLDPFNRLWFIFNLMPHHSVWATICDDPDADELVWSEPRKIGFDIMINKPIILSTGEWLFPTAVWREGIRVAGNPDLETKQPERGVFVFKSSDNGETFTQHSHTVVPWVDFEEPMMFEQEDGVIRMLVRTIYGIAETLSYDRGKTWCPSFRSEIKGPGSRFHIRRLSSGRVMLINHHEFKNRDNLTVYLSDDDGKTWPHRLLLDERNEVSYPDAVEHNGFIYIIYDRERGDVKHTVEEAYGDAREVLIAKVTEEDILAGKLVNPESKLKVIINKLGKYNGDDPNPFHEIDRCANDADAARMLADNFDKEAVLARIFDTFPAKCSTLSKVDMAHFDEVMERYKKADGIDTNLVEELIATVRRSGATGLDTKPIIRRIKAAMDGGVTEDLSIDEISQRAGISRFYMEYIFKKNTGITISDYKNELKLTKAKELLISSDMDINDISCASGFPNANDFSEKFVASEGISADQYRNLHKYNK